MHKFNYEEWNDKYHNRKIINLIDYLNDNDMNILNKLGISVENKKYTEYELDVIKQELNQYDDRFEIEEYDEKVKEDIRKIKKSLKEKKISNEMFYKLADKM